NFLGLWQVVGTPQHGDRSPLCQGSANRVGAEIDFPQARAAEHSGAVEQIVSTRHQDDSVVVGEDERKTASVQLSEGGLQLIRGFVHERGRLLLLRSQ